MNSQIVRGVQVKTIQTDQFKNNTIIINFSIPSHYANFPKLALLADLLENASNKYPGELLVSQKLSELYGASYGVTVLRYGDQHTLRVRLTLPDDQYVSGNPDLMAQGFAFLKEMIENPFQRDGAFDADYFRIHQTNLSHYLASIPDNKEFYATLKLQSLYYGKDRDHGSYLLGDAESINALDPKGLFSFYQTFMAQARIVILVAGKIDSQSVLTLARQFSFSNQPRQTELGLFVKARESDMVVTGRDQFAGSQSILELGYRLPIYFGSDQYFAAMVFDQLFGVSTRSLLFTNVREKASLAYDIHSSYNSLAGMLTVQAGIDPQNLEKVSKTIAEQLHQAAGGHYSDDLLAGVKRSMIDQHRSQSDYLATVVERRYFAEISGIDISDKQWEDSVNRISKADISKVADQVDIQAEYVLESQEAADEDD